jgi:YbbR domain-containing protein
LIVKDLLVKNLGLKCLSILFAISLWLFANLKATEERDLQFPLQWEKVPSFLEITNPVNDFVRVRVAGPRRILSNLNPRHYPVVLDLADAKAGLMDYQITEKMISLTPGLKAEVLPPDKVQFKFDLIVDKEVLVKPTILGKPPVGYMLERVDVEPERIEIVGAQSEIMGIDVAETSPIRVEDLREDLDEMVKIALDRPHVWPSKGQELVRLRLRIVEQDIGRLFRKVQVRVENPRAEWSVQPAVVDIYTKGPAGLIQGLKPEDLQAFVQLPEEEGNVFALPVLLRSSIDGIGVEIRPAKVLLKRMPGSG